MMENLLVTWDPGVDALRDLWDLDEMEMLNGNQEKIIKHGTDFIDDSRCFPRHILISRMFLWHAHPPTD